MALALASRWRIAKGAAKTLLAPLAPMAREHGFTSIFASRPPSDASLAREATRALGLVVAGVAAPAVTTPEEVEDAVAAAAEPASVLRRPLVVLDVGEAAVARGEAPEAAVLRFSRAIHAALAAWTGLSLALQPAVAEAGLFQPRELAWLLDDHRDRPLGLCLDPVRAARVGGPAAILAQADRFTSRVFAMALHGPGPRGEGHAPPDDIDADWGTLATMLPAGAIRVLDVGPTVSIEAVVDARRRFEEVWRY